MSEKLTITDVARELSVNERTVRRWIKTGQLSATRDMFGRYQIAREDLDKFVQRRIERYNEDDSNDNEDS